MLLRWQADRADRGAPIFLNQTSEMFSQTIQNRKRMLEMLRNTLENTPRLSDTERKTILENASGRIPHLAANGWVSGPKRFTGWTAADATGLDIERMTEEADRRAGWRRLFGASPTFTLSGPGSRSWLVFTQPVRTAGKTRVMVSALDINGVLSELDRSEQGTGIPLQVTQGGRILYRSRTWDAADPGPQALQRAVRHEGVGWLVEVQPRNTPLIQQGWFTWIFIGVCLLGCFALLGMMLSISRLRQLATTDELTQLPNRRLFLEKWEQEVDRAKRYRRDVSCLVIDVNHFKQINDTSGHLAGDRVLRHVAEELRSQLRKTDILARFGGDEFIVALPETGFEQASFVANKLRNMDLQLTQPGRAWIGPIKLSVGISHLEGDEPSIDIIDRADKDLYSSRKNSGVSRVVELNSLAPRTAFP